MSPRQAQLRLIVTLAEMPHHAAGFDLEVDYILENDGTVGDIDRIAIIDDQLVTRDGYWLLNNPKSNAFIHEALYEHELNESIADRDRAADLRRDVT